MKKIMLRIWAAVAIHWLKKDYRPEKKELICWPGFILKAERKTVLNTVSCTQEIERTFSIHRLYGPDQIGPQPAWWYEKYIVDHDCNYKFLRSGKYPVNWE
ncbi:MAG: hypothetical protein NC114_09930 [Ruminococcus flavefaciens]|nr:hypothetical protein [Ruminococcus flavefaciens]